MPLLRSVLLLSTLAAFALAACSSPPPSRSPQTTDGVPANSLSDARLHGEEEDDDADPGADSRASSNDDPTEPYVVRVGEEPPVDTPPPPKTAPSGGSGRVTRAECERAFDRYIELEIAQNPRLAGVPPHVIEQAKQMTRQQHGEAPCTATRAQYRCAMGANTTAAWQRCMK